MTGRAVAVVYAVALGLIVFFAVVVEARGSAADRRELAAAAAIRHEFGTGPTAGCMLAIARRETGGTFDPAAANWADRHADGSRGSFGILQIGALWRRPGETVAAFARRMFVPRENVRLGHELYRRYSLQPWGGRCG